VESILFSEAFSFELFGSEEQEEEVNNIIIHNVKHEKWHVI